MTELAFDLHESAMLLHDSVYHGEPQTGPFADFLGGKERLKNAKLRGRVHPHTRIANAEPNVDSRLGFFVTMARSLVNLHANALNFQASSVGHRVARVQAQVHNHLLGLRW